MKTKIGIWALAVLVLSCQNQEKQKTPKKTYTEQDTVRISRYQQYDRETFNAIVDNFPRLYQEEILHPDSLYKINKPLSRDFINAQGQKQTISFDSEAGKDRYFTLYAYFLSKKNDSTRFEYLRNDLTTVYQTINTIFERLSRGGTQYLHQGSRKDAYVEYDIHFINQSNRTPEFTKKTRAERYDFISDLKSQIASESKQADVSFSFEKEKIEDLVNQLNEAIVNDFMLYKAILILKPYLAEFIKSQENTYEAAR